MVRGKYREKCKQCFDAIQDWILDDDLRHPQERYKLVTRKRVCKYYASSLFPFRCMTPKRLQNYFDDGSFRVHHSSCYCIIPNGIRARRARSRYDGIDFAEYVEKYEETHGIPLNPDDGRLLTSLIGDTL